MYQSGYNMRSVIIDSSSAILMYKSNIIPALLKYCTPVIPEEVESELTVPGYEGSEFFTDLCSKEIIKVYEPEELISYEPAGSLHRGERDVIALFFNGKGDFIIIDDGRGGGFCRDHKIPYINTILAVKIFLFKQLITETEYAAAWRWLLANGRYSQKVIGWAEKADKGTLAFFI